VDDADVSASCRPRLYASGHVLSLSADKHLSADKQVMMLVLLHDRLDAIKPRIHT
jgi:hypothetical protein